MILSESLAQATGSCPVANHSSTSTRYVTLAQHTYTNTVTNIRIHRYLPRIPWLDGENITFSPTFSLFLSLSLSLTYIHSHTHTHTHTQSHTHTHTHTHTHKTKKQRRFPFHSS